MLARYWADKYVFIFNIGPASAQYWPSFAENHPFIGPPMKRFVVIVSIVAVCGIDCFWIAGSRATGGFVVFDWLHLVFFDPFTVYVLGFDVRVVVAVRFDGAFVKYYVSAYMVSFSLGPRDEMLFYPLSSRRAGIWNFLTRISIVSPLERVRRRRIQTRGRAIGSVSVPHFVGRFVPH